MGRAFFAVAYAPNGKNLAVAGESDTIRFVSPAGQQLSSSPTISLPGVPTDMAYSPDGTLLAVSISDGRILIYDPSTGILAYPPIPSGAFPKTSGIAWSPTGIMLAGLLGQDVGSFQDAESVELLKLDPRQWASHDCVLADGNLPILQWAQYAGPDFTMTQSCATNKS
jgi:WD40 repeat protein